MKQSFMNLINWFARFMDNTPGGGSIRKFIALWVMVLITRVHNKYLESQLADGGAFDMMNTMLYVDYGVILVLLGLIVAQDIIKFKNGNNETPKTPAAGDPPVPAAN